MAIPINLEEVGYNQATVKMDVDALTRESMIRLFNLTDDNGNKLGEYDEKYDDLKKTNTGLDWEQSGTASLVRQFILLESKVLGFLFQQFLSMVKPIQTALELPQLLTNPPQLVRKIKDIIDGIKDLINDVVSFFTDTLNWFLDLLIGEIMDVNIPIPPLEFSILGITIPIPSIDKLNMFGKEPYLEVDNEKVNNLKDKIASARDRIKNLKDKINPDIDTYQIASIALLIEQINKLLSVNVDLNYEFYNKAMQIQNEVILEKDKIIKKYLDNEYNFLEYKFVNQTSNLKSFKTGLDTSTVERNYLKIWIPDNYDNLINMADNILQIIETEEKQIEDTVNNYKMESNEDLKDKFDKLDVKLNNYTDELLKLHNEIRNTNSDIDDSVDNKNKMEDNLRDLLVAGGGLAAAKAAKTINDLKDQIKSDISELAKESPASAWIQSMIDLVIGVIKSPIDIIINIISKIIEGILEFIKELPLPTFTKIKEFFSDLLGLANPEKMQEILSNLILDISGAGEEFLPVIENIVSFLPWLFVEIAKTFIESVVQPLPISI
jgi:predicted  nucleic acid-binding Zn-ribbon protein